MHFAKVVNLDDLNVQTLAYPVGYTQGRLKRNSRYHHYVSRCGPRIFHAPQQLALPVSVTDRGAAIRAVPLPLHPGITAVTTVAMNGRPTRLLRAGRAQPGTGPRDARLA